MDSLMAVEFLYRVNMALKTSLSRERLSANAAIRRLAEELAAELNPQDVDGRGVESASRPQPAAAMTLQKNAWFPDHRPAPNARVRLFCFHPPGASVALFSDWWEPLWPDAEVAPEDVQADDAPEAGSSTPPGIGAAVALAMGAKDAQQACRGSPRGSRRSTEHGGSTRSAIAPAFAWDRCPARKRKDKSGAERRSGISGCGKYAFCVTTDARRPS